MAMQALYDHPGFAPVEDELTGVPLTIRGSLPRELDGLYLRNGTNPLFAQRRRHMFDVARDGEGWLRISGDGRVPFGVHALWLDRAATDQLTVTAEHDR
jgi:hypothetical protein